MSFFKGIFSKSSKERDASAKKDIEKVKSGEVTKVYPVLKPGDWVGIKTGALKQTLFGTQEQPLLVAAFGYDAPENFVFLMPHDVEGKDSSVVLNEAYENLEKIPSKFSMSLNPEGNILTASGYDFASEKILCKNHMLTAHGMLQAQELLVSIPRRKCMMMIPRNSNSDLIDSFTKFHQYTWNDDSYGNAPIVNAFFVVTNGEIEGLIPLDE